MAYARASADRRVSNAQWFRIAQQLCEGAGITAPTNAAEASTLIGQLKGTDQGSKVECPSCKQPSGAHTSDCAFAAFVSQARST